MIKIKKVEQLITWQSSLNDNLILLYSNLGLPLHCYHCLTLFGMQAHFFKNRFHIFNSCRIEHNWIEHNTSLTAQLIILPAHVLSILRTKRTRAQTEKTRRKLTKRKNRKKRKKIITKRLQIGTTRIKIIRIKQMFIFLATASLKN